MKNFQNKRSLQICLFVLVAVVALGIGYASISAINLFINGNATASVNQNNFKVYFTSTDDTPSLTGNVTVTGTAEISSQDNTVATFNVGGLTKVGDYAIATYTVLNDSEAIGAEISLNVTNSNNEYFKVTETILDNKLQAGETTTATVKVEMTKTPINNDVTTSVNAILIANPIENTNATGGNPASKIAGNPESFATDSWATIKKAVQDNNTSVYSVGDTKIVTINNTNYTVRLVNKSTHDWCDNDAYSQTACEFVVEFAEIYTRMPMNNENTNFGGWPTSDLCTYLNETFYNSLPSDLKNSIKITRVISGHGNNSGDLENKTSNNKIFLLSLEEVYGPDEISLDTDSTVGTSIQLDYYDNLETSYDNYESLKKINEDGAGFWLRNPYPARNDGFFISVPWNKWIVSGATGSNTGVVPVFRIG